MSLRVLLRPLARPSVLTTVGLLALLGVAIKFFEREYRGDVPFVMFLAVYNILVGGMLISFGGFLGRITTELESIRISRAVPGLRRKVNAAMLLLALLIPALGTLFLWLNMPEQFAAVPAVTQWSLQVFLFSLALGLRGSWLFTAVLSVLLLKISWLLQQVQTAPWISASAALTVSAVLLSIRHRRFLTLPPTGRNPRNWSWLNSPFSTSMAPARRSQKSLRDRPGWRLPDTRIISLVHAGSFERFGHRRGRRAGALVLWAACSFPIFGLLAVAASKSSDFTEFLTDFAVRLFTTDQPTQNISVLRHLFAVLTGGIAYVAAVTLDGTLRPNLWHPISRSRRGTTVFLSHMRLNFHFATILAALSCVLLAIFGYSSGSPPSLSAVRAFLMPALLAFILMPIPQALFPDGPDTFHRRVNPLKQLGAGLLGGGLALLTFFLTAYWPPKRWESQMLWVHPALLVATGVAVYGGYFVMLRYRNARIDLRTRTA